MFFKNNFDFVAIGDTTIDAFIRIKEASVNCDINKENCQLCLDFANKVPYESVTIVPAVGNSANAAVACLKTGVEVGICGQCRRRFKLLRLHQRFQSRKCLHEIYKNPQRQKNQLSLCSLV